MASPPHPTLKNNPPQENPNSFLILLETHRNILEMFLSHQEALLRRDFPLASERLRQYERAIRRHIREEEALLLPVYARAGKVLGGDVQLFLGEHQRIVEFIVRLKKLVPRRAKPSRFSTKRPCSAGSSNTTMNARNRFSIPPWIA